MFVTLQIRFPFRKMKQNNMKHSFDNHAQGRMLEVPNRKGKGEVQHINAPVCDQAIVTVKSKYDLLQKISRSMIWKYLDFLLPFWNSFTHMLHKVDP